MSTKAKKGQVKGSDGVMHPKKADFECVLDEDAVTVENNGKLWELSMDARVFKPEEIKIKITSTHVVIEGSHETEEEVTECNEEIVIPEGVLPATIEVLMNSNGVLRIRAPIQRKEIELVAIETKSSVTTTETTEKRKMTTKTRVDEDSEEVTVVETKFMDATTEAKILQDKKFVDSTKDIVAKDGKLEMNVDVRGVKEEDIKVSVSKRIVAIQAVNQEDRSKEIHKKFLIPDGIDPGSFRTLLKKGVLTVSMDDPKAADKKPKPAPGKPGAKAPAPPTQPPKPEPPVELQSQVVEPKQVEALERRCEDITKQVATIDNKKFQAKVNVAGYKAEELRMKITKKTIIVHTETKTMTRQFSKKISIPAGVRPETIRNTLTPENGILTISAPIVEEPQTPAENVAVQPQLDLANTSTTTESHFEDISKQIQSGAKKFQVEVDVSDYKPEEIEIKILKSIVTIKGTQTVTKERQSSSRQFFKKFSIPQGVKAESIKCTFTTKGTLQVYSTESTTEESLEQVSRGVSNIKPEILGGGLGSTSGQIISSGDSGKFERKVDAQGYKEEEIKVTIANGWITINGKQQMGPELNFQTRQFTKKFSVPYGVKPEAICCNLQPNGTLIISAGGN